MTARWLVKTEPSAYAYTDLERDGGTRWDGIRNAQALIHLRAMKQGDQVLVYHTGGEKAVVGVAKVTRGAYPDPAGTDPKLVAVDLAPLRPLAVPVTLAAIRKERSLADLALVRHGRLSVMPVPAREWAILLRLGEAV